MQYLRDLEAFFGVRFKVKSVGEEMVVSCVGVGYSNVNKAMA